MNPLDIFPSSDLVSQWEAELAASVGKGRLDVLVRLSWGLRQRDTWRALHLAEEAEQWLGRMEFPSPDHQRAYARLQLVRGEAQWLLSTSSQGQALAEDALRRFSEAGDLIGAADAHLLSAMIGMWGQDGIDLDHALDQAVELASLGSDTLRADVALAQWARMELRRDPRVATARWNEKFGGATQGMQPCLAALVNDYQGGAAYLAGDHGQAVACFKRAHEVALETGQFRGAIVAATNVCANLNCLHDLESALEWARRGMDLARAKGWPSVILYAQVRYGDVLRLLGRLEAAQQALQDALSAIRPEDNAILWNMAAACRGGLALDLGQWSRAVSLFDRVEARARSMNHPEFQIWAACGKARAQSELGHPEQALLGLHEALDAAAAAAAGSSMVSQFRRMGCTAFAGG